MGSWTFGNFNPHATTYEEVYLKVSDLSKEKLSKYGFKRDIEDGVVYLVKGENEVQVAFNKRSPIDIFSWCGGIDEPVSLLEELLEVKLNKLQPQEINQ